MSALLWSATCISIAVAQTNASPEIDSQSFWDNLINLMGIIPNTIIPVFIFSGVICFRQEIAHILRKKAKFQFKDILFEFGDDIRTDIQFLKGVVDNQGEKIQTQQTKIKNQQEIINKLVLYSMSSFIYNHLKSIYYCKNHGGTDTDFEYIYHNNENMRNEMCYLRDNNFIKRVDNTFLEFDLDLDGKNLVPIVELTDAGNWYVELRINEDNDLDNS